MDKSARSSLLRRYRIALAIVIAGLVFSGLTAFPMLCEVRLLSGLLGLNAGSPEDWAGLGRWILTVRSGLEEVYAVHPWLAYGTDWLGFAHLVIACFFIGPLIDPASARGNILVGIAASLSAILLALIAGPLRGIPLVSRLIDCSFGVVALALLLYCLRLLPRIAALQADPQNPVRESS